MIQIKTIGFFTKAKFQTLQHPKFMQMLFNHSYLLLLFPHLNNSAVSTSHVKGADVRRRMSLMLWFQRKVRFLLYSFMTAADNCFLSYTYTKSMNVITAAQCRVQSEGSIDLCINQKPSSSGSIYMKKIIRLFWKSCIIKKGYCTAENLIQSLYGQKGIIWSPKYVYICKPQDFPN